MKLKTDLSRKTIETQIAACERLTHFQQVAYSTYENCLTQVCFTCGEVRSEYNPGPMVRDEQIKVDWSLVTNRIREMRDIQGQFQNWKYSPYMHGLYNGLELSLACIEDRTAVLKDLPVKYLHKDYSGASSSFSIGFEERK